MKTETSARDQPCPFCGKAPERACDGDNCVGELTYGRCYCRVCDFSLDADDWNRRAQPSADAKTSGELAELRADRARLDWIKVHRAWVFKGSDRKLWRCLWYRHRHCATSEISEGFDTSNEAIDAAMG